MGAKRKKSRVLRKDRIPPRIPERYCSACQETRQVERILVVQYTAKFYWRCKTCKTVLGIK